MTKEEIKKKIENIIKRNACKLTGGYDENGEWQDYPNNVVEFAITENDLQKAISEITNELFAAKRNSK